MRLNDWGVALLVASILVPTPASSDENPWVPALSGWAGVIYQNEDATGSSSPAARSDIDGDSAMAFAFVGLSAELMAPKLPLPGGPALFVQVGSDFSFGPGWNVAKEGSAGTIEVPLTPIGGFPPPSGVSGTGTTAYAEPKLVNYRAGIGVAFEFPLWERTLRLRPSLEYRWDQIDYRLQLADAQPLMGTLCPCGLAQLSTRDQESYHSIGPGIELEMDAARSGPLMLSLYISGRFYRLLGNEKTRLSLTGSYTPSVPSREPVIAEATLERADWTFQGGLGLRFRWLPE